MLIPLVRLINLTQSMHCMFCYLQRIIILTFLQLFFISAAFSQDQMNDASQINLSDKLLNYLTDGASITAGIGGRSTSADVTRQGTEDHGKMIENVEDALFLTYNTKASYFGKSNAGYAWLFNLSTFNLKDQELANNQTVNLGTEVEGYFAYAVPTFFYNIGDRYRGHFLRTGIGLGIGLADFKGDVILTESFQTNDRVDISNGTSNVFFALGVFIDYQWNNFTIRIASAGPNINYNGYEINIADSSVMFGLTYYLGN